QGTMPQEISAQSAPQRDNHKWHDHNRHDRMRRQHREINRPRHSLPYKARGAMVQMVNDVRNQKHYRRGQRGKLTTSVRQDAAATNEIETQREQDETRGVEGRVEVRENGVEIRKKKAEGRRQKAEGKRQHQLLANRLHLFLS